VRLADADRVRERGHPRPHDLDVGILLGEPREDDVVGRDGRDLAQLELDQAVGRVREPDGDRTVGRGRDVVQGRRAGRRADALPAQVGEARRGRRLRHQHALARLEVLGRERDLLPRLAGHRQRAHHDVHLARLQRRRCLRGRDDAVLDVEVVAEDGLAELLDQVDVEALDLVGERVQVAEVQGVLRDARDHAAAVVDLLQV
jgi:hypothetical protein